MVEICDENRVKKCMEKTNWKTKKESLEADMAELEIDQEDVQDKIMEKRNVMKRQSKPLCIK